jgi:hypothetical protein
VVGDGLEGVEVEDIEDEGTGVEGSCKEDL